ncbi:MAG: hypothetical protein LUC83_09115 [Clostridiales bacterium]|nr:hypothetical protein [Clostridiales bacterium]
MNTKIEYYYRDCSNYRKYNVVVVSGKITPKQITTIISCLEFGELFVPEFVGLPAERLEEYEFQPDEDTPFLELSRDSFSLTDEAPTCDMTVDQLVSKFEKMKGNWYMDDFSWFGW